MVREEILGVRQFYIIIVVVITQPDVFFKLIELYTKRVTSTLCELYPKKKKKKSKEKRSAVLNDLKYNRNQNPKTQDTVLYNRRLVCKSTNWLP